MLARLSFERGQRWKEETMALTGEERRSTDLAMGGLQRTIQDAQDCLLSLQRPSGEWCGELEGDSILESEFILLMHSLGRTRDPLTLKVANYLRKLQTDAGGWAMFPGCRDDVSATVKAYFALKLVGDKPDEPHMRRAREASLTLGGVTAT